MGTIRLKVCGMRDQENIGAISALNPDYLGFIFYPESPRYVGKDFKLPASEFKGDSVGVFVNESIDNILRSLKHIGSLIAQLHGTESPDDCRRLRDLDIQVIKALPVGNDFNGTDFTKYKGAVDYFLFDTKGKLFGGNSVKFDWKLLEKYDQDVPFFLSGGIGVNDLQEIGQLENMNLHAVDMNSGVEISPGLKDPLRVKRAREIIDNM